MIYKIKTNYYTEHNIRYVFINGSACTQIAGVYKTLQQQLSIPDYFGNNLDALEEVLSDLEWIPEAKIKIIIANHADLLSKDKAKRNDLLDILNSAGNKKLEMIYLGVEGEI